MHDRMARYGYSTSRFPQDRDFRSSRAERESPDRMARYSSSRISQDRDFRSIRAERGSPDMMDRYNPSRLPQDRDFRSSREERVSPARYDTSRLPQDKDFRSSRTALDRERSPHGDRFQTGAYRYGAVLYRNYAQIGTIHILKKMLKLVLRI